MFRPLRRTTKAIPLEEAKKLLKTERRGVFAVIGDEGYPYAVPVDFLYDEAEEKIYFHGSAAGHKADSLKKNDKVCFTVYGNETIGEEEWAPYVQSVVVFGRCRLVADRDEVIAHVRGFAMKYFPSAEEMEEELSRSKAVVQLYEITIEHLCGKQIQER